MDERESATMTEHAEYWRGLLEAGRAIVFGPVADPAGTWGLGIVDGGSPDDARALGEADPAVVSGVARFEVLPMRSATTR
ncbi:YciI family protein [Pseudonocardia sp. RS010]|uniref:YciI family protein n=1 Tax=Pseudonocardia sp. RS010 TaxID=3385979 RepID=UPI0039A3E815